NIADIVLARFPNKLSGWSVDVEAIVEAMGFDIIFRPMLNVPIEGYVARKAKTMVINEYFLTPIERYRFTLAEELAHHILEFQLWQKPKLALPEGARVHELTGGHCVQLKETRSGLRLRYCSPRKVTVNASNRKWLA